MNSLAEIALSATSASPPFAAAQPMPVDTPAMTTDRMIFPTP
jgi:hypothetical protein